MVGQYPVVNSKLYACTRYAVMGPKQYNFAATQAACVWSFQFAPKTHTRKGAGTRPDHFAFRLLF